MVAPARETAEGDTSAPSISYPVRNLTLKWPLGHIAECRPSCSEAAGADAGQVVRISRRRLPSITRADAEPMIGSAISCLWRTCIRRALEIRTLEPRPDPAIGATRFAPG